MIAVTTRDRLHAVMLCLFMAAEAWGPVRLRTVAQNPVKTLDLGKGNVPLQVLSALLATFVLPNHVLNIWPDVWRVIFD